jgi:hypothetical protein
MTTQKSPLRRLTATLSPVGIVVVGLLLLLFGGLMEAAVAVRVAHAAPAPTPTVSAPAPHAAVPTVVLSTWPPRTLAPHPKQLTFML